ncbi:hypothetical protein [Kamptonema formosum]|uniref:hypothetical protein n=1 Tax=Kamptonema formosum TaxID=331992 RepID=UPI0003496358|nr:hypothetical protein [Oscillatoria sp. PCC 10802]
MPVKIVRLKLALETVSPVSESERLETDSTVRACRRWQVSALALRVASQIFNDSRASELR